MAVIYKYIQIYTNINIGGVLKEIFKNFKVKYAD